MEPVVSAVVIAVFVLFLVLTLVNVMDPTGKYHARW